MRSRHAAGALAAAIAAGGLVLAGAPIAQAADTGITVLGAHNDYTNNGKLVLSLSAPTAIGNVQVSLFSESTQQTVATVDDFTLTSGTTENGTWEPRHRIQLPDLGSYRIDVSASDAGGDTLSAVGAGYFYYEVTTSLNDTGVDRTTVDYFHRSVTISGHLMGQWPGNGVITPLGAEPVYVYSYIQWTQVTTAADGSFSATLPVTDQYQNTIQAQFSGDPNSNFYSQSTSRTFPITIKKTATKVIMNPSTLIVPWQGVVPSTSATLLWNSPDGWQPMAGKTLGSNSFGNFVQETTDADGNAVFPATPSLWSDYTIQLGWASDDIFLTDAIASRTITVVQPASFLSFTPTRTDASTVTVAGDMSFAFDVPGTIPVKIQFSATGKGSWTTVATIPNAYWDGQGYGFSGTVSSTKAGFWRATFSDAPDFQSAVSDVIYLSGS